MILFQIISIYVPQLFIEFPICCSLLFQNEYCSWIEDAGNELGGSVNGAANASTRVSTSIFPLPINPERTHGAARSRIAPACAFWR
jgi:hypothetical protein